MSQVAAKKKLDLIDARSRVIAHFREQGSVLRGDQIGECLGFEIELDFESGEPEGEIRELIRLAEQMCFTRHAIAGPIPLRTRSRLNGSELGEVSP